MRQGLLPSAFRHEATPPQEVTNLSKDVWAVYCSLEIQHDGLALVYHPCVGAMLIFSVSFQF